MRKPVKLAYNLHVKLYLCMYVRTCVCKVIFMYVRTCVCKVIFIYVCTYVCMCKFLMCICEASLQLACKVIFMYVCTYCVCVSF